MRTSGQKEKKKVLKESALLEMDGNRVYQDLRQSACVDVPLIQTCLLQLRSDANLLPCFQTTPFCTANLFGLP